MDRETELIRMIVDGDREAFGELLDIYRRMIYKIIYGFNLEMGDFLVDKDELFQEASITLYDAVFLYEDDKDMKFSSFAYMLIRRRLISLLRYYRHEYEDRISLDRGDDEYQLLNCFAIVSDNPEQYHKEKEFEEFLGHFVSSLSEEDRRIVECRNDELSYREIGERLHISYRRIDNRLRSMKKRFREEYRRHSGMDR